MTDRREITVAELKREIEKLNQHQLELRTTHAELLRKIRDLDPWLENVQTIKAAGKVGKILFKVIWWVMGVCAAIASMIAAYYSTRP